MINETWTGMKKKENYGKDTDREVKRVGLYKGDRPGDGESKKFCKERKKNCWFICKMREYVTSKNRLNVNITRRKNI